ncbi:MAG: hypothetical protein GX025_05895 [Clostridiales bacterium]|nr:hypothetical protein [Clostridiales bacterium]
MKIDTQAYLEKVLLDTQERVRSFAQYSDHSEDDGLKKSFKKFAIQEGYIAQEILSFLNKSEQA